MAKLVKVENKKDFEKRGDVIGTTLKLKGLKTDSNNHPINGSRYYEFLICKADKTKVGVLPTKKTFKINY